MLSKIRQYFELIKYCFFGGITTLLNLALLYVFVEMGGCELCIQRILCI